MPISGYLPHKKEIFIMNSLEITSKSGEIAEKIWNEVSLWKYFEKETVGKQLVRAADSISANLSEAEGRYSYADRKRFVYYARGSLFETINWIQKSVNRKLIESGKGELMISELETLSHRINTFLRNSN